MNAFDSKVPELAVAGLDAYIGTSHTLSSIDLEVTSNCVTVLLGRNGAGKTTTLRSIIGLTQRTGSVRHRGDPIQQLSTHMIIRRGIGYVPEDRNVFSNLTVAENLRLAERTALPRYDLAYDLFPDLKVRERQLAGTLSGGQQQMLALARALINDNTLLLIDEPTKGLAPKIVNEVVMALERIKEFTTILMVEQNLNAASRLADNVVVLANGRVTMSGSAEDIMADTEAIRRSLSVARSAGGDPA